MLIKNSKHYFASWILQVSTMIALNPDLLIFQAENTSKKWHLEREEAIKEKPIIKELSKTLGAKTSNWLCKWTKIWHLQVHRIKSEVRKHFPATFPLLMCKSHPKWFFFSFAVAHEISVSNIWSDCYMKQWWFNQNLVWWLLIRNMQKHELYLGGIETHF